MKLITHFEKENITEVKEKLLECLKVLGSSKPKMDKFFKKNDFYNNEMLNKEYGWTEEETRKNLEWYARYDLGRKIYKHLKNNDECYFSAEL
jgi:predicted DNA-binding transcriptional regulator AlpA